MKDVVVVPTIREDSIRAFLDAWRLEFTETHIIVVEDNPTKTFEIGDYANVTHYCWGDIDNDLGKKAWIIPRRTDCIRSYGYYKAYQESPDMVVTLDDDCYPIEVNGNNFLKRHWQRLDEVGITEAWYETGDGVVTRGFPYFSHARHLPCMINHGLWNRIPDYDAPTQLLQSRYPREFSFSDQTIPVGVYYPMCGMNLAFRPEVIPALYFLLMGRDYQFDRFGDIWAGILVKKICDHLHYCVKSGTPAINHERASNVWQNLRKESAGLEVNEYFWQAVDRIVLTQTTFKDCYQELAEKLEIDGEYREYWKKQKEAMVIWANLF